MKYVSKQKSNVHNSHSVDLVTVTNIMLLIAVYTEATGRIPMDQLTKSSLGVLGSSLQLLLLHLPFCFALSFIDPEFLNPFDVCCPRKGVF
jgi:hypothetical protein